MEEEGDVATAFTMARIVSNIPISRGGPTSVVIYDIHALQERFYFADQVLPLFETGIPLLTKRLQQLPETEKVSLLSHLQANKTVNGSVHSCLIPLVCCRS